jgi:general secretion pathway protein M
MSVHVSAPNFRSSATKYLALGLYLFCLFGGLFVIWNAHDDLNLEELQASAARDRLELLQNRRRAGPESFDDYGLQPGDQFLGGDKVTVAAAELQRRVASEVTAAGGGVISSRIERSMVAENDGELRLAVEFEIEQSSLQGLLYNIEASTPFIFVEKLGVRSRSETAESVAQPRLRVALLISATWREQKS